MFSRRLHITVVKECSKQNKDGSVCEADNISLFTWAMRLSLALSTQPGSPPRFLNCFHNNVNLKSSAWIASFGNPALGVGLPLPWACSY